MRLTARLGPLPTPRGIHRNTHAHPRFSTPRRDDASLTATEPTVLAKRRGQTLGRHE